MNLEPPRKREHQPVHYAEIPRAPSFPLKMARLLMVRVPWKIKQYVGSRKRWQLLLFALVAIATLGLLYYFSFYLILIVLGFCLGYFICAPDTPTDMVYTVHRQVMKELFSPHCYVCKERMELARLREERHVKLCLPNPLHDKVLHVVSLVIRDFIDVWYLDLCKFTKERHFQSEIVNAIKTGINTLLESILVRQPGELCTTIASALCSLLQRHIKEYKKYQRYCSKGEFMKAKNILSLSPEKEQEYLYRIATMIINHVLPEEELQGNVAKVFLEELFGGVLIKELVELLSEPTFLNVQIIDFLDFEKKRLFLKTKKGYCLLRIRLLRGRNIQCVSHNSDFFHVTLVMCGKKLKSKKKRIVANPEFNEEFRFKIPDNIARHDLDNSVMVSLKETNTFKVNEYLGTCEFFPLLVNFNQEIRGWHTLVDESTGTAIGELELEYSMMKYSAEQRDAGEGAELAEGMLFGEKPTDEDDEEGVSLNLGHVLSNHEFFLEFYSFLTEQKAHSYLHLWVSIDSFLRAFLRASSESVNLNDEINLLGEARMIFSSHFDENVAADNLIPLSNQVLYDYKTAIVTQQLSGEQVVEIMRKTQDYLFSLLDDFYFPLFKETSKYSMLRSKLYREQHEAYLSGLTKTQPADEEIIKSATEHGNVIFVGCKLTCRLLWKGEKATPFSSTSSGQSSASSSRNQDNLISYLAPVTSMIVSTFGKNTSINFQIDIALKNSLIIKDLTLSSYSVVRSYSQIHHLHKQLCKQYPKLEMLHFPPKKVSNEEKRKQMEYQMENYLNELISRAYISQDATFVSFLYPNTKELQTLKGGLSTDFDADTSQSIMSAETPIGDSASEHESIGKKTFRFKNIFKTKKKPLLSLNLSEGTGRDSGPASTSNSQLSTPVTAGPYGKRGDKLSATMTNFPNLAIPSATSFDENSSIHSYSSGENVDFFLDSLFSLVTEAFDVSGRGQWIKRQILNTIKQILKQTQSGSLKNLFEREVASRFSYAHLNSYLTDLEHKVWPNGTLLTPRKYTKEERESLAAEAKPIFLHVVPDSLNTILGKGKVSLSLSRLFFMLQHQDHNKIFIYEAFCEILEILFSLVPPNSAK